MGNLLHQTVQQEAFMNIFSHRLGHLILLLGPILFLAGTLYLQGQTVRTSAPIAIPASAADWGLSFQTEGQLPVGNAVEKGDPLFPRLDIKDIEL